MPAYLRSWKLCTFLNFIESLGSAYQRLLCSLTSDLDTILLQWSFIDTLTLLLMGASAKVLAIFQTQTGKGQLVSES